MTGRDGQVGQLLKKRDNLGVADKAIVIDTTLNGAEAFSGPDGGATPFRCVLAALGGLASLKRPRPSTSRKTSQASARIATHTTFDGVALRRRRSARSPNPDRR